MNLTPVGRRAEDEGRDQMTHTHTHTHTHTEIHKTYEEFTLHARREDGCGF